MLTMNEVLQSLRLESTFCAPRLCLTFETVVLMTIVHILKLKLKIIFLVFNFQQNIIHLTNP